MIGDDVIMDVRPLETVVFVVTTDMGFFISRDIGMLVMSVFKMLITSWDIAEATGFVATNAVDPVVDDPLAPSRLIVLDSIREDTRPRVSLVIVTNDALLIEARLIGSLVADSVPSMVVTLGVTEPVGLFCGKPIEVTGIAANGDSFVIGVPCTDVMVLVTETTLDAAADDLAAVAEVIGKLLFSAI